MNHWHLYTDIRILLQSHSNTSLFLSLSLFLAFDSDTKGTRTYVQTTPFFVAAAECCRRNGIISQHSRSTCISRDKEKKRYRLRKKSFILQTDSHARSHSLIRFCLSSQCITTDVKNNETMSKGSSRERE